MAKCPSCGGNLTRKGEEYVCDECGSKFKKRSKAENTGQQPKKDKISDEKSGLKDIFSKNKIKNQSRFETVPALLLCLIPSFISAIALVLMFALTWNDSGTAGGPFENFWIFALIGPFFTFVIFSFMFGFAKYIFAVAVGIGALIWRICAGIARFILGAFVPVALFPLKLILAFAVYAFGICAMFVYIPVFVIVLAFFAGVASIFVLTIAAIVLIIRHVAQRRISGKYYIWVLPLTALLLIVSVFVGSMLYTNHVRSSNLAKRQATEEQSGKLIPPSERTMDEEQTIIDSIDDIDPQILESLNAYAQKDLTAKIASAPDGGLGDIMQNVTQSPGRDVYGYSWEYDYITVDDSAITPISYSLFFPDDKSAYATKKGVLKINYRLSLSMGWGFTGDTVRARESVGKKSEFRFDDNVYISYYWAVDLHKKTAPIENYADYTCDYRHADCDYENWYNRNILSMGDYMADEVICE